jgi:hypothetical protein
MQSPYLGDDRGVVVPMLIALSFGAGPLVVGVAVAVALLTGSTNLHPLWLLAAGAAIAALAAP